MGASVEKLPGRAFLAFPEMRELLVSELERRFGVDSKSAVNYGDLMYFSEISDEVLPYWSRSTMLEPFIVHFDSIGDAAGELKKVQRSWAPYNFTCFRRASLLQEKLPYVNLKKRDFPFKVPQSPIGLYTLIDDHTLVASASTTSPLPAGQVIWNEDHENPPSRAYLKIQESLILASYFFNKELPHENDYCFEAGACPGGWTWVLVNLGAEVFAVDRAELAPSLMENPLVRFEAHDAFTYKPEDLGKFDWIFSDVICYPERLLSWIKMWLESGNVRNMICTIKMQGEIDWNLIRQFEEIPNSRIVHLNYNKHELTFMHCE